MEITPTIQEEVQTYLKRKGLTLTEFGHIIELNIGKLVVLLRAPGLLLFTNWTALLRV